MDVEEGDGLALHAARQAGGESGRQTKKSSNRFVEWLYNQISKKVSLCVLFVYVRNKR